MLRRDIPKKTTLRRRQKQITSKISPPNVLFRKTYFLNKPKTKYITLGIYPSLDYTFAVEIGHIRGKCIVLSPYHLSSILAHLSKMCENVCPVFLPFKCVEEKVKLQTVNKLIGCKIQLDNNQVTLKLNEIRYLVDHNTLLVNIISKYKLLQTDIKKHVEKVKDYVPENDEFQFSVYDFLKEEVKEEPLST